MNTSPASGGNVITLTRPRYSPTAAPARASGRVEAAESAAARAAGRGSASDTAAAASRAIRVDGTGWNYQTRALALLERGDYQSAAADFQSAISAYRDQKARGERVSEADAGIRACQSGLALALRRR